MDGEGIMGVMGVEAWRARAAGEMVTLPSGMVARIQRVHVLGLAEQGEIPAPLAGLAAEMVSGGKDELKPEELERYAGIVNLVVMSAFVEPKVGEEGTETQLGVREIEMTDRLAVFNWSQLGGRLRKFRPEQKEFVEAA